MRQSRASSGVEEPTALYRQRGKPTRGDGPCEATARREVKTLIPFKDTPRLNTPHPYLLAHLCIASLCQRPPTTHRQRAPSCR